MKKHILLNAGACCAALLLAAGTAVGNPADSDMKPCIPKDAAIESKVSERLQKMTLDEKIGQMCELSIDVVTDFQKRQRQIRFQSGRTRRGDRQIQMRIHSERPYERRPGQRDLASDHFGN